MPDFKYKNLKIKLSTSKGLVGNNIKSVKILKWKIKKKHLDAAIEIYNS